MCTASPFNVLLAPNWHLWIKIESRYDITIFRKHKLYNIKYRYSSTAVVTSQSQLLVHSPPPQHQESRAVAGKPRDAAVNFPIRRVQAANVDESRHLGFDRTGNSAIRSADSENPAIEPNMRSIPQRHGQTDGRTYRQTTCRSNTALCVASRCKKTNSDSISVCQLSTRR